MLAESEENVDGGNFEEHYSYKRADFSQYDNAKERMQKYLEDFKSVNKKVRPEFVDAIHKKYEKKLNFTEFEILSKIKQLSILDENTDISDQYWEILESWLPHTHIRRDYLLDALANPIDALDDNLSLFQTVLSEVPLNKDKLVEYYETVDTLIKQTTNILNNL